MNIGPINSLKNYRLASYAGILLGIAVLLMPGIVVADDFVGSAACKGCHEVNFQSWSASGHPYKLMKSEEARYRPIPLPLGLTWEDDVSYVIGGYKWKSRYIDKDGYIITVTEDEDGNSVDGVNQYNYLTGEWVDYHAGEVEKPYDCGTCHTTNWVANPDPTDLSGNQDGLPGMWGTFDAGGVHCEQCHGNGTSFSEGMQVDKSAEACGTCHYRTSPPGSEVNSIPASGGFVKHHEQYNEYLAGPHSNPGWFTCVTCHDPHKRGEFSIKEGSACTDCHSAIATSYATEHMAGYGVECKDCHMPYATKSANKLGPFEGDLQTHIFYINTDADGEMFTEAGDFVALDGEGKAAVTLDFACKRCHETAEMTELAKFAKNFHGTDTEVAELEYIGINPGLSGNWWGGLDYNGEGFMVEVAYSNDELVLVASFYTYDSEGNPEWLFATGNADTGMTTSNVKVYISDGQRDWAEVGNPANPPTVEWGTAVFTFTSCTSGTYTLTPNATYMALGFTEITYDLQRDIVEPGIHCPSFSNEALAAH